jgi:hypothetical protein
MARNGNRKPPRPRIELMTPAASPEEAAAVTAAIEQFLADTAPAPKASADRMPAWQWAGLQEGVRRAELVAQPPRLG